MISKKNLFIIWLFGLISGFTIMITGNTLNYWLAKEEIDIKTLGFFALISIPYAINFLWAPLFDIKKIPLLTKAIGNRLSWIICIQLLLSIAVYRLSTINPTENLLFFAEMGVIISFLSSSQDTVLGALRTEIIDSTKQGQISGIYVLGYRIGTLISGSGAIYISAYTDWHNIYKIFSVIVLFFPILLLLIVKNTEIKIDSLLQDRTSRPLQKTNFYVRTKNLLFSILSSISHSNTYLIMILGFLILYRLPDNFITMMINPFLMHIGYNEFEIATTGKFFGVTAAIIGGLLAGGIMKRLDIFQSLLLFGVLHAFAHMLFILQEVYGKNIKLFLLVTGFESITGGMTMAAYIGYIASLCHGKFKATQYSFLTSMMGLSRSILPAISGYIVTNMGWKIFYFFASAATIPSLILIIYLRRFSNKRRAYNK